MGVLDRIKEMFGGSGSAPEGGAPAPTAEATPPAPAAEPAPVPEADPPPTSEAPAPADDVGDQPDRDATT